MSQTKINQLNYSAGDLNTSYEARISGYRDYMNQNPMLANRQIALNASIVDPRFGAGPYRGIVVRVEPSIKSTHSSSEMFSISSFVEMNRKSSPTEGKFAEIPTPEFQAYKVYIPDIDIVPNPRICLSLDYIKEKYHLATHERIDRLHTFISMDSTLGKASEGELVYVDFGNRRNFEDPVYLGPVYENQNVINAPSEVLASETGKNLAKKKNRAEGTETKLELAQGEMKKGASSKYKKKGTIKT